MNVELWKTVNSYLRENDVETAAIELESRLSDVACDRFLSLAKSQFTNRPSDVLAHINEFADACQARLDVRAIYLEMNGFEINYDRWYFDSFAYPAYDDSDDLDWLCEWSSPDWQQFTLYGLEEAQEDFRWYIENKIYEGETHDEEKEIATLLVMVRFVQLIRSALNTGAMNCPVPVLATAHDFDMVARFRVTEA